MSEAPRASGLDVQATRQSPNQSVWRKIGGVVGVAVLSASELLSGPEKPDAPPPPPPPSEAPKIPPPLKRDEFNKQRDLLKADSWHVRQPAHDKLLTHLRNHVDLEGFLDIVELASKNPDTEVMRRAELIVQQAIPGLAAKLAPQYVAKVSRPDYPVVPWAYTGEDWLPQEFIDGLGIEQPGEGNPDHMPSHGYESPVVNHFRNIAKMPDEMPHHQSYRGATDEMIKALAIHYVQEALDQGKRDDTLCMLEIVPRKLEILLERLADQEETWRSEAKSSKYPPLRPPSKKLSRKQ